MISDERFTKKEHLLKTGDFAKVYKKGRSFRSAGLVLCCLPNALKFTRIGFSIGSRVIKLANDRNRIRRLLREAYRKNKKDIKAGFDIIIVVKKNFEKPVLYKDMEKTFLGLIRNAGLL